MHINSSKPTKASRWRLGTRPTSGEWGLDGASRVSSEPCHKFSFHRPFVATFTGFATWQMNQNEWIESDRRDVSRDWQLAGLGF